MKHVQLTRWGNDAIESLRIVLAGLKESDPLSPVSVVAPNMYSALALRRVASRFELGPGGSVGLVNVSFTTLPHLAGRLGAEVLANRGKRPLTGAFASEAVRRAIDEAIPAKDPLRRLSENISTERAFERTMSDLRPSPPDLLEALADSGGTEHVGAGGSTLAAHAVAVYRAYEGATTDYYDIGDLVEAAVEEIDRDLGVLREIGEVVLQTPIGVGPLEWPLLEALARAGVLSSVLALTGEAEADAPIRQLAYRLESADRSQGGASPGASGSQLRDPDALAGDEPVESPDADDPIVGATRIVSAPDADEEVRSVIRELVRSADAGEHLYRKAILYASPDPYAGLIVDRLLEASLPFSGMSTDRLVDTAPGGILAGAIQLTIGGLRREDLAHWLGSSPVINPDSQDRIPARRWDHISRRAGVFEGADSWGQGLDGFVERERAVLESLDEDASDQKIRAAKTEIAEADRLKTFIAQFDKKAGALRPEATNSWSEFSAIAGGLLDVYSGGNAVRSNWPPVQQLAFEKISDALTGLRSLDRVRSSVPVAVFTRAVDELLEDSAPHDRHFGDGIFVGRIADAVGANFDAVYILGLTEGVCPTRVGDDPLIPEATRQKALAGASAGAGVGAGAGRDGDWPPPLRLRRESEVNERRTYLAALAAGSGERVLMHPVGDTRTGRAVLPSPWLVEQATRLSEADGGRRLRAEDLVSIESAGEWHRRDVSFDASLGSAGFQSGTDQEYRLAALRPAWGVGASALAAEVVRANPEIWRGIAREVSLADERASEFSGYVGPNSDVGLSPKQTLSATALERWTTCPYMYFMERVLRVGVVVKPEAIEEISALERGRLIHTILERFLGEFPNQKPSVAWGDLERNRLREIAESGFIEAESAGITGRSLLWDIAKKRILGAIDGFLEADNGVRQFFKATSRRAEVAFGFNDGEQPPIKIGDSETGVAFRGRIDRVDLNRKTSTAAVFDYKTGRVSDAARALHRVRFGGPIDDLDLRSLGTESGGRRYGFSGGNPFGDPTGGGRNLQPSIYARAVRDSEEVDQVFTFYWYLDLKTGANECYGFEYDSGADARLEDVVRLVVASIDDGVFPAKPGKPSGVGGATMAGRRGENCTYCDFDSICPGNRQRFERLKRRAPEFRPFEQLAEFGLDESEVRVAGEDHG